MDRRMFITASAAGLASSILAGKLGAAPILGSGVEHLHDFTLKSGRQADWYTIDVVMQEGPSPNGLKIWPAQVLRNAVKNVGTPPGTCQRLYCVDSWKGDNKIHFEDVVAEVVDLHIIENPCRVACQAKWLKTPKAEAMLKKVCTNELRLCAAGIGSTFPDNERGGDWQVVEDGFCFTGFLCGKRAAFNTWLGI